MRIARHEGVGRGGACEVDQVLVVGIGAERRGARRRVIEDRCLVTDELDVGDELGLGDVAAELLAPKNLAELGQQRRRDEELKGTGAEVRAGGRRSDRPG